MPVEQRRVAVVTASDRAGCPVELVDNPVAQLLLGLLHPAAEAEDASRVPLMTTCRLAIRTPWLPRTRA
jgi:hypothetical protein